jgi:hypothetical protein
MPANGGLLRIGGRSPGSGFGQFQSEIADSLRRPFEIFPFLGDEGRRRGSIGTAWPVRRCYLLWSPTIWAKDREFSIVHCVTGVGVCLAVEGPLTARGPQLIFSTDSPTHYDTRDNAESLMGKAFSMPQIKGCSGCKYTERAAHNLFGCIE